MPEFLAVAGRWLCYDGTDTGAKGKEKQQKILVERKPSMVLAKTNASHQASTGGRPMMIMALMVAPTLEQATLKLKPADGGHATRA